MRFLFCYDISSPKRLSITSRHLSDYGVRIQKSFFLCDLTQEEAKELFRTLTGIIKPKEDSLFMYRICGSCQKKVLMSGPGAYRIMEDFIVL